MNWFRRLGRDESRDRRVACRYPVAEGGAWLGWWGEGAFQSLPARLLNVSLGGSLLEADVLPADPGQSVFLHLGTPSPEGWVVSDLVATRRRKRGGYEARLAFPGSCPYDFFKAAVFGREAPANA